MSRRPVEVHLASGQSEECAKCQAKNLSRQQLWLSVFHLVCCKLRETTKVRIDGPNSLCLSVCLALPQQVLRSVALSVGGGDRTWPICIFLIGTPSWLMYSLLALWAWSPAFGLWRRQMLHSRRADPNFALSNRRHLFIFVARETLFLFRRLAFYDEFRRASRSVFLWGVPV
jgi:hypothetical protein